MRKFYDNEVLNIAVNKAFESLYEKGNPYQWFDNEEETEEHITDAVFDFVDMILENLGLCIDDIED